MTLIIDDDKSEPSSSINCDNLTIALHREYDYYAVGKWLYYPDRVACIKEGDFREVTPVTAQLCLSLYCNFACPRCSYGRSKLNLPKYPGLNRHIMMDYQTMTLIIDRLHEGGIRGLVFTGGGEPSLNPFLIDGMRYAVGRGLKIGLFTNGSLLTEKTINAMMQLEPVFLRISLDAGSPSIHSLVHGYPEEREFLTTVLDNLMMMAKQKLHLGVATTIGVGVSVEPVNLNDLVAVAERLREIANRQPCGGIDYVVFRPTVNYTRGRLHLATEPVLSYLKRNVPQYYNTYYDYLYRGSQLPRDLFDKASEIIENEVSQILEATGITVININTKMRGIAIKRPYHKCRASPWYIFIGPDGTVYNCVELALDEQVSIGNILNQTLSEIWRNPRRQAVMDYMDDSGLQYLCPPVCLYYELNTLFEKLDSAFKLGGQQRDNALSWITSQEARIRSEQETGLIGQHHVEFI